MEIAALYGNRAGLEPGAPTFVGREDTLRDLFRRMAAPMNVATVAITGPRRCGKTSLLKQTQLPDVRDRFVEGGGAWDVAYIDLSSHPWQGFDAFRRMLLHRLAAARGVADLDPKSENYLEDAVRKLVQGSSRPLVALLDEFNAIAAELGKDEQGELRGALGNVPEFGAVLGVARSPEELLEYIGDVVSDLAPIISIAHPPLRALTIPEARKLVRIGRTHASLSEDGLAEAALLQWVGRHPLLLQTACYAWYSSVGGKSWQNLTESELRAAESRVEEEVRSQLPFVRRALSPHARMVMNGRSLELTEEAKKRAQAEIQELDLAQFIIESGEGKSTVAKVSSIRAGTELSDHPLDPIEELTTAVEELNRKHQLLVARREWVIRSDALAGNDVIYLRRTILRERPDFKNFIEALARLLYDGSDAVVAPALRGKVKPRLPRCCYKDPRSLLYRLVALRNYYLHLPTDDAELAKLHLAAVGDIFLLYAGIRAPEAAHLEQVRKRLLDEGVELVRRLAANLPLDPDLPGDTLFD